MRYTAECLCLCSRLLFYIRTSTVTVFGTAKPRNPQGSQRLMGYLEQNLHSPKLLPPAQHMTPVPFLHHNQHCPLHNTDTRLHQPPCCMAKAYGLPEAFCLLAPIAPAASEHTCKRAHCAITLAPLPPSLHNKVCDGYVSATCQMAPPALRQGRCRKELAPLTAPQILLRFCL
jgi:hypothetical protein